MAVKRIVAMTSEQVSKMVEAQKVAQKVCKVFTVKDGRHTYYVQEMPGMWNRGRDFAVMKDRMRFHFGRFKTKEEAKSWLLKRLLVDMGQRAIDLHV